MVVKLICTRDQETAIDQPPIQKLEDKAWRIYTEVPMDLIGKKRLELGEKSPPNS